MALSRNLMLLWMPMPTNAELLKIKLEFSTKISLNMVFVVTGIMTRVNLSCCVDDVIGELDVALEVDFNPIETIHG